jgi:hypothetical protein
VEQEGPQTGAEAVPAALAAAAQVKVTRVYCNQHGQMEFNWAELWWECRGWAGEGCLTAMIVTAEQVVRGDPLPGARIAMEETA